MQPHACQQAATQDLVRMQRPQPTASPPDGEVAVAAGLGHAPHRAANLLPAPPALRHQVQQLVVLLGGPLALRMGGGRQAVMQGRLVSSWRTRLASLANIMHCTSHVPRGCCGSLRSSSSKSQPSLPGSCLRERGASLPPTPTWRCGAAAWRQSAGEQGVQLGRPGRPLVAACGRAAPLLAGAARTPAHRLPFLRPPFDFPTTPLAFFHMPLVAPLLLVEKSQDMSSVGSPLAAA